MPAVRICSALSLLVALGLAGCGSGAEGEKDRVPVYPVSGKITIQGSPVTDAAVMFSPKEEGQPFARGRTDSEGNYTLMTYDEDDGAAAGDYVVLVTKTAGAGGGSDDAPQPGDADYGQPPSHSAEEESDDSGKSLVPERYTTRDTSNLTATVKTDGKNEFNFDLKP